MARSTPPRFVVRTTVATLIMVAGVLTAVFVGFALNVREGVRDAVSDKLEAGQRMLSALEQRRERELGVQVATIAENPTLRTAVATYKLELGATEPRYRRGMLLAIERELRTLAAKTGSDVLAVADTSGTVIAAGGRRAADWPLQGKVSARHDATGAAHVSMASGVFQFASAPLVLQQQFLGTLQLARAFDAHYAQELSALSGAATLITSGDAVVASTLPADLMKDLTPAALRSLAAHDAVRPRLVRVRRQTALPGRPDLGLRARLDRCLDPRSDAEGAAAPSSSPRSGRSRSRHSPACGWRGRSRGRSTRSRSRSRR